MLFQAALASVARRQKQQEEESANSTENAVANATANVAANSAANSAANRSKEIDEELRLEGIALRKRMAMERKVLLLDQSGSGKSTLLEQFRLFQSKDVLEAEKPAWRLVIAYNLIRFIVNTLEEVSDPDFHAGHLDDDGWHTHSAIITSMRVRLSPLRRIAELIANRLASSSTSPTSSSESTFTANSPIPSLETRVPVFPRWKLEPQNLHVGAPAAATRPVLDCPISLDDENVPFHSLAAFRDDIVEFCTAKAVWEMFKRKNASVVNTGSFFIDNVDRILDPHYIPTDEDISRARIKTQNVRETQCPIGSGPEKNYIWRIFDLGGARYQRAAWAPYFEDVDCIIFLAPISAFDEVLAEDPTVNCLEDSLILWRDLCKNKILAGASIVLFLNKCDLLRAKLEAGVRLNQFLVSYGDRPNDYANVTKSESFSLKSKFDGIRREHCPDAQVYTHFITAIDSRVACIAINAVRDRIMRQNLENRRSVN